MDRRKHRPLSEEKLIGWLKQRARGAKGLLLGIGDDAAVVSGEKNKNWLLKTDMVVEGVHFKQETNPGDWARKVVMANISDIAAMGGVPRWCMVALGLPASFSSKKAEALGKSILGACREYGITLVGGDISRSQKAVMTVAMTGVVSRGKEIRRSGARQGDVIFVTGALGGSLASGRHLKFTPRLKESRFLADSYSVNSMIDVSDGLSKDLRLISEASRVGMRIFTCVLPLHADVKDVRRAFTDGEDFELLFTMKPREARRLMKDYRWRRQGFTFYPIGRCTQRRRGLSCVDESGRVRPFPREKDHHFAP